MANPIISFDGRICIIDTYKSDIFDKSDRILDDLVALDEDMNPPLLKQPVAMFCKVRKTSHKF